MPQGHGPEAPRSLGRYELVVEVAKGQLGAFWLAHVGAELFAIRRVQTGPPIERADVNRLSEAAWWSLDVRHENVATVLDVVMTETELGVVTRYAPGEPLRSLLRLSSFKRKPVAAPIAMRIAVDVLSGLGALHEQAQPASGVSLGSGGVNPDTVLIGAADGRASLLDVGIASVASGISSLAQHPELGAYSAPEQLDEASAPDPRSDVFSLGVLLWEMISRRRLFAGSSQALIREKLEACAIPRLDATKPVGGEQISAPVADLVARALARDPADRFESADAMSKAIHELGSDMVADCSAVAALVEDLAGQAIATRSKALKRATMPQKSNVVGPRPQLPTLVGIAPEQAAAAVPPPAAVAAPARAPVPPVVQPTAVESEPAAPAPKPGAPPDQPAAPAQASTPEPVAADASPEESVDVDVSLEVPLAIATDPPVSEPEPTTIRRASAPEDVFAQVRPDPSPISERELVEALTRESNPGPPPLESIDFTARGSDSRISPAAPAPTAVAAQPAKPAIAAAPQAAKPTAAIAPQAAKPTAATKAEAAKYVVALTPNASASTGPAAAELVSPPERPRAPMISDFEGPPSQEQIERTQKARKVVAGVVAGLGLLLVIGLIVSAFKSEDPATSEVATSQVTEKPRSAPAAKEPVERAALPQPQASIAASDHPQEPAEKTEPAQKTEPEKAEPAPKTEPVKKTEPAAEEKAEAPRRAVTKSKSTVTKPRSTVRATSKPAAESPTRPAAKPKPKKPKYVPSGI